MRRSTQEIRDPGKMLALLEQFTVCRLGMRDGEGVYIVPMSFGYTYEGGLLTLFFHCAKEGHKLDLLAKNPLVTFEMDMPGPVRSAATACAYGVTYRSMMGQGQAGFLAGAARKVALEAIMRHYAGTCPPYEDSVLDTAVWFGITVSDWRVKVSKDMLETPLQA